MKKIYVFLLVIFFAGCDLKTNDFNYYDKIIMSDVYKVSELSNQLFLYEKNLDTEDGFNRYYYIGDDSGGVYPDLVTYFGFINEESFQPDEYEYKFVGTDEVDLDNCVSVGINVDIMYDGEEILYSYVQDEDFINYCVSDGKPYSID